MGDRSPRIALFFGVCGVLILAGTLMACVEAVPQDAIDAVESIDGDLKQLRAAEFSPNDYAQFTHQWMTLKSRVQAEEDLVRWPWETNDLELALRRLHEEGAQTVARLTKERESLRHAAESKIALIEDRIRVMAVQVGAIDGRLVLGQKPIEADLLMKQAHTFYEQGQYDRSLDASARAAQSLAMQTTLLSHELGRYADRGRINLWQRMAQDTVAWSRDHRTSAIVVNKADRELTLYRNGMKVVSYPVRLGFNGIREKRYQGDGATPEGRYRISRKRGEGQTQFYRALVLDYPNEEDRRRYRAERKNGGIPYARAIGGQIEIHGVENESMAQTLGCVMLDNQQMMFLFERVDKGAPVTIVGALHEENSVAQTLALLGIQPEET